MEHSNDRKYYFIQIKNSQLANRAIQNRRHFAEQHEHFSYKTSKAIKDSFFFITCISSNSIYDIMSQCPNIKSHLLMSYRVRCATHLPSQNRSKFVALQFFFMRKKCHHGYTWMVLYLTIAKSVHAV